MLRSFASTTALHALITLCATCLQVDYINGHGRKIYGFGVAMNLERHKYDERQFNQLRGLQHVGRWMDTAISIYEKALPIFLGPKGFPPQVQLQDHPRSVFVY